MAKKKDNAFESAVPKHQTATYRLSKTKYCTGLQCQKALYLTIHHRELASVSDESAQQRMEYGKQVGTEAQKHYPGGVLVNTLNQEEAIAQTQAALKAGVPAIFEAGFFSDHTLVRVDVLRNNQDGTHDIFEVKSSTSVKEEHIPDMAIQRYIAEKNGIAVRASILKHLNRNCTFPDLKNLFVDADCTEDVLEEMKKVPDNLNKMFAVLDKSNVPSVKIGPQCDKPNECAFKAHCWEKVPDYSVLELGGVWASTKFDLYHNGSHLIKDIPDDEKVSRSKPEQIKAVKTGKPVIDKKGIQKWLDKLEYPLYFLDFETIGPPIPRFKGTRPYQQIPFQYSCHKLEQPNGTLEHVEFLADSPNDPRMALVPELLKSLGTAGSIISYNASFEMAVIESLAKEFGHKETALFGLIPRFVDMLDVFKKHYFHADFHGSNSIKATLPVLVPEMNYKSLEVRNGTMAQIGYESMFVITLQQGDREKIRNSLLQYCHQDTLAMGKLLEALSAIVERTSL